MFSSIKAKIIVFYLIVISLSLFALGLFLYLGLEKIIYDSIDSSLLSRAKALATLISEDGREFKFSDELMWEYSSPKSGYYFQIRKLDGTTVEKSASLKNLELPFQKRNEQISFKTIYLNKKTARLVNFPISNLIIQCAENIDSKIELLEDYGRILSISILVLMAISTFGGLFIAKKALTPVKKISETISRISESNLSERINEKDIPSELKGLASSFNHTFDNLERAFNRQKQFVSDASHELRTPLSVILSHSEITLRKERSSEEYRNALIAIKDAAKIMLNMIERLLMLARLSSDRAELKFEEINLYSILKDVVKLLNPLAEQKDIKISIHGDEQLTTFGDRASLLELFTNIIDNAIKYNIQQGKVDISIKEDQDYVLIEVKNTGVGIPEEDLDKLFDRFYRVDKARSGETKGAGLGLSICKEIVQVHGGKIEIKSRIGEGTTVSIYLERGKNVVQG